MTAHIVERPWTEVAGLRIVNGTVQIGPHMPPTHRWMMEGVVRIIEKFVEWLPDRSRLWLGHFLASSWMCVLGREWPDLLPDA